MIRDIIFNRNFLKLSYRLFLWHCKYTLKNVTPTASPLACGFYISSRCNLRCQFCNIWRINPEFQVPLDQAQKIIYELGKMGLIYLSFSGGEPLLIPYLFDLLIYAKKNGIIYTHIVSNGYLMDKDKAKKLADVALSEISFSLDGAEEFHDKNRGVKGSFKKVIEAVHHMGKYAPKTKIVLNTILDPFHPENAISAVKIANDLGQKIKIQPLNCHPSFGLQDYAVKSEYSLTADEKRKLFDAIDLIQKSPNTVNSKAFLECYKAFIFSPKDLIFTGDDCIFGYHHIEFFAGKIFPCLEGMNWEDGFSIYDNSRIREIITSGLYNKKLKQLKKCSHCSKSYYICYYEPRLNFPIWNFIKSRLRTPRIEFAQGDND